MQLLAGRLYLDINAGIKKILRLRKPQHCCAAAEQLHIALMEVFVYLREGLLEALRHAGIYLANDSLQILLRRTQIIVLLAQELAALLHRFIFFDSRGVNRPKSSYFQGNAAFHPLQLLQSVLLPFRKVQLACLLLVHLELICQLLLQMLTAAAVPCQRQLRLAQTVFTRAAFAP